MNYSAQCEYTKIVAILKAHKRATGRFNVASYLGTKHVLYNISTPVLRHIARKWVREHRAIESAVLMPLLDRLFRGPSREEKNIASYIIASQPQWVYQVRTSQLDNWAGELTGWEEVDVFCSNLMVPWFLHDNEKGAALVQAWAKSSHRETRRASLVTLCGVVRKSDRISHAGLALSLCSELSSEKHVMITKAISWLLRSMTKYHQDRVVPYVRKNSTHLPSIAVRETERKIRTGKK